MYVYIVLHICMYTYMSELYVGFIPLAYKENFPQLIQIFCGCHCCCTAPSLNTQVSCQTEKGDSQRQSLRLFFYCTMCHSILINVIFKKEYYLLVSTFTLDVTCPHLACYIQKTHAHFMLLTT